MTDADETPELQADLSDVLRLITELATVATMGRRGRQILFALANAAHDVERFEGLVVEGEVYGVRWHQEWAPCGCRNGDHTFSRDGWFGRSYWTTDKTWAAAKANRLKGHLVTRLLASTTTEVVQ